MAQLPRILKNLNLFADGIGTAGFIEEMTVPTLALTTEDHRAGGMDLPVEIDMGMEKLELSFQLSDPNEGVMRTFGRPGVLFIARSGHQRDGEDAVPVVVNMTGTLKGIDPGNQKPGGKAMATYSVALTYYKLAINGIDIIEVDPVNMVRKVNGVDQLQTLRAAIGV